MYNKFFKSKYPIVEAGMFTASTLPFALVCWEAGIFPSLAQEIRNQDDTLRYDFVNEQLKEFVKLTGSGNVAFTVSLYTFLDLKMMNIIRSHGVSHIELTFPPKKNPDGSYESAENVVEKNLDAFGKVLRFMGETKILWRTTSPYVSKLKNVVYNCIGNDGGGRRSTLSLSELFDQQKKLTPDAPLMASGGIHSPKQVSEYIKRGAVAVSIGTLLAASKESPLSEETKKAIINSSKESIIKLPDTEQSTLILGNKDEVFNDNSDRNRTKSLTDGVYGDGKIGHVYVGKAIEQVNSIKTVKEIVEYLVSEL